MKELFPVYPHLGMSEDQLAQICEELFQGDTVLASYLQRIEEQEGKRKNYEDRMQAFLEDIRKMELEEDEITARLKALTRQKREAHGLVAGLKYHVLLTERRVQQSRNGIERRKKQLYLNEARRRLSALGKELKLGRGRRAEKGLPSVVLDKPKATSENQEAQ